MCQHHQYLTSKKFFSPYVTKRCLERSTKMFFLYLRTFEKWNILKKNPIKKIN